MKFFQKIFLLMLVLTLVLPAADKKQEIPDYSMTPRKDIPVKFTWNVADIYKDKATWSAAKEKAVGMIGQIDALAKGWTSSADSMLKLLKHNTELEMIISKLYSYASHQGNADMSNPEFKTMKGEVMNLYVGLSSKLSFIDSDILSLGEKKFRAYLKENKGLAPYSFDILSTYRAKPHILPADQQKIVARMGLFSGIPGKASGILNNLDMPHTTVTLSNGKKITLNYANYAKYRGSANPADRALVMKSYWDNHSKFANTHAALMDAAMKKHHFNATIHKYKNCLEARLFGNNIDPLVYTNMVKQVKANLEPMHRYLKLKKELLGLKELSYNDIYASAIKSVNKLYPYKEARKMITTALKPLGKEYIKGLNTAFDNRWVDIYPNKGKQTGAYSGGVYGVHPYIKMNYDGKYSNVSTLAHELGHAMHSWFSNKAQPYPTSHYTTFLAEMASTFNENMLMSYLLKHEKDDLLKLYLLDRYFEQCRGTIYRQALFADFEHEMHKAVEAGKTLTPQWLNKKYLELTRFYYGHNKGIMRVDDYIQNEWSGIPHFYMNYYVFTYTTGMISSMALNDIVEKEGKKGRDKYLTFLKAGGSKFPLDILKDAGVDMTTEAPYKAAFNRLGSIVSEMEKIVQKLKKKNKI